MNSIESSSLPDSGECCCAGTRTFVHEKIYDEFVKKSVEFTKNRKCGDPFDESVTQGPQIDERSQQKILRYIESANKQGAKLETGGKRFGNAGFYVEPTIFSNVTDNMTIDQDEVGQCSSLIINRSAVHSLTFDKCEKLDLRPGAIYSQIQNFG